MRKFAFLALLVLLIGVAVAPSVAQDDMAMPDFIQHSECDVDLTGETVPVYHFGDLSGPYAFITQPLLAGLADAISYFNAHGGVCGANLVSDIETNYRDTGGDLAQAQASYDAFSTQDDPPDILYLYASGDSELLRDQVAEDEIPVLISAGSVTGLLGENGDEPGWIFATNPLYVDQLGAFCDFVAANPDRYPDPVIGYLSWGGAFGEAAFQPESLGHCDSVGVGFVETPEYFSPAATDITGNMLNLVDAGANIIYTNSLASGPAIIAQTVLQLGLEDDVQLAGVNWVMDTSVALLSSGQQLGSDGLPAVNGLVGSLPFHWWSERSDPGIAFITEQATLNERSLPTQNIAYLLGWGLVDTHIELYTQAVNEVGSIDAVDGALMKDLIENLTYSPLGLYDFDFQGGAIRALPNNRIAQMFFLNAEGTGPATSGEDAMKIPRDDGSNLYIPLVVPLTDFAPAPSLLPGSMD
jgi:ABC-type branched-subunit amino acid transport system substrate-binding protein